MGQAHSKNIPTEDLQQPQSSKLSVVSVHCRICYDDDKPEDLMAPCLCKGTMAFVHRSCLETWLGESALTHCELCHQPLKTKRILKYTAMKSLWYWFKYGYKQSETTVRGDMITCGILNPLGVVVIYICLYSSEHYSHIRLSPTSKLTAVCLLVVIAILFLGYYLWVNAVVREYYLVWYSWWQRTCTVSYIAPSSISLNSKTEDQVTVPNNTPCFSRNFSRTCSESDLLTTVLIHSNALSEEELLDNNGFSESQNSIRTEVKGDRRNDSMTTVIHFRALTDGDLMENSSSGSEDSSREEVVGGIDLMPSVINIDDPSDHENLTRKQTNVTASEDKLVLPCEDISSFSQNSTKFKVLGDSSKLEASSEIGTTHENEIVIDVEEEQPCSSRDEN